MPQGHKRSKITRDRDRDVSEKIALGLAQPSGQDMQFDQRLFNQVCARGLAIASDPTRCLYDRETDSDKGQREGEREGERSR